MYKLSTTGHTPAHRPVAVRASNTGPISQYRYFGIDIQRLPILTAVDATACKQCIVNDHWSAWIRIKVSPASRYYTTRPTDFYNNTIAIDIICQSYDPPVMNVTLSIKSQQLRMLSLLRQMSAVLSSSCRLLAARSDLDFQSLQTMFSPSLWQLEFVYQCPTEGQSEVDTVMLLTTSPGVAADWVPVSPPCGKRSDGHETLKRFLLFICFVLLLVVLITMIGCIMSLIKNSV